MVKEQSCGCFSNNGSSYLGDLTHESPLLCNLKSYSPLLSPSVLLFFFIYSVAIYPTIRKAYIIGRQTPNTKIDNDQSGAIHQTCGHLDLQTYIGNRM